MAANKAWRAFAHRTAVVERGVRPAAQETGDDAAALEQAEHALAAVAAGTVDAAALDPSVAALARHREATSADEQSSRFGQAVAPLLPAHERRAKTAHRVASQIQDDISKMVAQVTACR